MVPYNQELDVEVSNAKMTFVLVTCNICVPHNECNNFNVNLQVLYKQCSRYNSQT